MLPAGMVSQEREEVDSQQVEASGPQQNLMALVLLSKLAEQGMRGIAVSFWSAGWGVSLAVVVVWWGGGCTVRGRAQLVARAAPVLVRASLLRHEIGLWAQTEAVGEAVVVLVAAPCCGAAVDRSRRKTRQLVWVLASPCVVACQVGHGVTDKQSCAGEQHKPRSRCCVPCHGWWWRLLAGLWAVLSGTTDPQDGGEDAREIRWRRV